MGSTFRFSKIKAYDLTGRITVVAISLLVIVSLVFGGIVYISNAVHAVEKKKIAAFRGSVWESKDPRIILRVSELEGEEITGTIEYDGTTLPIRYLSTPGLTAYFYTNNFTWGEENSNIALEVYCKYKKDKVVMKIITDNLFDGRYKEITMIRTDNDNSL